MSASQKDISNNGENEVKEKPLSYSFACSGWLKMYLFGVAKYLQEKGLTDEAQILGSSGGALAAAALGLGCDFDILRRHVLEDVVPKAHQNIMGAFQVKKYLTHTLETYGNLHEYEKLNKTQRITIVYTSLPSCTSKRLSSFTSKESLQSALMASCTAPPIAGLPFYRENEWVIDGGLSDFQPIVDAKTVTISPFYCTRADIRPSTYVPLWWALYPPGKEQIAWIFELGYSDAETWAETCGYVPKQSPKQKDTASMLFKTSFGRFTGYRSMESHIMDLILVCLILIIWKPLAFILMYAELLGRAAISCGKAAVFGAACSICGMIIIGGVAAFFPLVFSLGVSVILAMGILIMLLTAASVSGSMQKAAEKSLAGWQDCTQCLRLIISLSLFLRSIPLVGSTITIKRQDYLYHHSFVYRLMIHLL